MACGAHLRGAAAMWYNLHRQTTTQTTEDGRQDDGAIQAVKILFLFIDGVGLSAPATDNPVNPEVCPALCALIARHSRPIDACLGVEGIPQSATGQATMFTGVNCARAMGRHCEGFPGPGLRKIIEESNLFLQLCKRGKRVAFADAYLIDRPEDLAERRFKSVTTVMAMTAPQTIRTIEDLMANRALLQDLTRETIQDRYPDVPAIPPQRAAGHLVSIASENDFTLYEFFQTDVAGHSMDHARACAVLRTYDRFLEQVVQLVEVAGITLVMTADHGNIESISNRAHTCNPVPFIAYGPREEEIRSRVRSLCDVTPAILESWRDGE